jgi:hypothetical protein
MRLRESQEFRARARELMCKKLGMVDEFWTMNSVLDRDGICHPEGCGYIANGHWRTCRALRKRRWAQPRRRPAAMVAVRPSPLPVLCDEAPSGVY